MPTRGSNLGAKAQPALGLRRADPQPRPQELRRVPVPVIRHRSRRQSRSRGAGPWPWQTPPPQARGRRSSPSHSRTSVRGRPVFGPGAVHAIGFVPGFGVSPGRALTGFLVPPRQPATGSFQPPAPNPTRSGAFSTAAASRRARSTRAAPMICRYSTTRDRSSTPSAKSDAWKKSNRATSSDRSHSGCPKQRHSHGYSTVHRISRGTGSSCLLRKPDGHLRSRAWWPELGREFSNGFHN